MKILKAETTALRAFLQFNSWSEARNHGLPDHDGKAVNSLLGFARQIPVCRLAFNPYTPGRLKSRKGTGSKTPLFLLRFYYE